MDGILNNHESIWNKGGSLIAILVTVLLALCVSPSVAYAFTPRTSAPENSNAWYYSSRNPYYTSGLAGQCTWYAWGRASEILGTSYVQKANGNGGKFWVNRRTDLYQSTSSDAPRVGALACATGGSSVGHVAVVESIESDGTIVFSEYWGSSDRGFHLMRYRSGAAWARGSAGAGATFQGYIYLQSSEPVNHDPVGTFDSADGGAGTVHVRGWAFDPDNPSASLTVHVYIGGDASSGEGHVVTANASRPDVNNVYGISGNHGFDVTLNTNKTGNQPVVVYLINTPASNINPPLPAKNVTITPGDTTKPVITNVKVTNVTKSGYTVSCTVTDNVGVDRVMFPTWTSYNGQDDLAQNWQTNPAVRGTQNGNTWTFRVNASEHNNELGEYATDICAYDKAGNTAKYATVIANLKETIDISEAAYGGIADHRETGSPIEPKVSLVYDNAYLEEGTDYTLSYANNVEIGEATVTIKGIGKFSGTRNETFSIVEGRDISKSFPYYLRIGSSWINAGGVDSTYDGTAKEPGFFAPGKPSVEETVATPKMTIEASDRLGVDFTATYKNNVNVGTAVCTVTGISKRLYGTRDITFEIVPAPITKAAVAAIADQTHTGKALTPKPVLTFNGATLKEGTDYTLSYQDNTEVGQATVTISGRGNFNGTTSASFNIVAGDPEPESLSEAKVTLETTSYTYDGNAKKPTVTVELGSKTLKEGTDYTVSYKNNVNVGTATVTVKGKGDYTGTKTATFTIERAKATWKRLAGKGRYDTMASIVGRGWSGETGGTVIVATGASFKDALAAAGLAGLDNAPVVLTDGKALSGQAAVRLQDLAPSTVYVAGGPLAVSDTVLDQISYETGVTPQRLMGKSSSGTSAALARAGKGRWADGTAIIATNRTFKDALSAAPVAYAKHWPILLADNGKSLSNDVLSAMRACGIKQVYIVGGERAVTPNVVSQLNDSGIAVKGRLAGKSGVETSRAIANFALRNGLGARGMAFATSQNYPDALAGAAFCGKNGAVLLLADDKATGNISFAEEHASEIGTGYVFGGPAVFSDGLFASLP